MNFIEMSGYLKKRKYPIGRLLTSFGKICTRNNTNTIIIEGANLYIGCNSKYKFVLFLIFLLTSRLCRVRMCINNILY
jgi:hypothetical protein